MFTEVLTGMALVKAGVDFIKSNIDTMTDMREIFGHVEKILDAQDEIQKKRNKKSKNGIADQLGLDSVAQEVIDAKLAKEHIEELRIIIDNRFGNNTWQEIVTLRSQRKREKREKERLAKIEARKQQIEFEKNLKLCFKVFLYALTIFCLLIVGFSL